MINDGGPVPTDVLRSFGAVPGGGEVLPGGEGRSVRYSETVLKPTADEVESRWACDVLAGVAERGFRVSRPVRANDGRWVVDGWTASSYAPGQPGPVGRWQQLLDAGRALHRELAAVDQPAFLARRSHRWAHADRVAWSEEEADPLPEVAGHLARLRRMAFPVQGPRQLVHGDLAGNVVFCDGLAPAIIDFSPFWRPVRYADAIVAVDGMLWFGADRGLLSTAAIGTQFRQYLVRAAIFRLVAFNERARADQIVDLDELTMFERVIGEIDAFQ
jgi:uncharacterized protein (TIGR02569 family)